ncbi:MAG: trypsin-like peptidase domain-containing protein [Gemmatimonadota bacterium]|nr:MAG: trypsin-like peptidase domain-containing protein [Gemmatimonadota bacterium]
MGDQRNRRWMKLRIGECIALAGRAPHLARKRLPRFKALPAPQRRLAYGLLALLGMSAVFLALGDIENIGPLAVLAVFLFLAVLGLTARALFYKQLLRAPESASGEPASKRAWRERMGLLALSVVVGVAVLVLLALDLKESAAGALVVLTVPLASWCWLSLRARRAHRRAKGSLSVAADRGEPDTTDHRVERLERLATAQLDYLWGFSAVILLGLLVAVMKSTETLDSPKSVVMYIVFGVVGIWLLVRLLRLSWPIMARKDGGAIVGPALISSAIFMSVLVLSFYAMIDEYAGRIYDAQYEAARERRRAAIEGRGTSVEPEPAEQIEWRRELPGENDLIRLTALDFNPRTGGTLYDRSADAVVTLDLGRMSHGTGFLITRDGLALTNEHVVAGAQRLTARFRDGREAPVRVIRQSADVDVALIQIACREDCTTLPLGSDSELAVGIEIVVFGTPWLPELHHTLSKGVISALRFEAHATEVQVDAAISPGSSGSPILDARRGRLLGIIRSGYGTERGVEGLSFGASVSDALRELGVRVEQP